MKKFACPLLILSIIQVAAQNKKVSQFVNPFIGTAAHGHTYPGATLPFGMVQLGPDNGTQGWDWCSGYNYADTVIAGFSHTHLSGTGIGDLCDISMLPLINTQPDTLSKQIGFSHANEKAVPGFYSVALNNGVQVNLTTSKRVGYHQYFFPKVQTPQIRLDLGFAINWDSTVASTLQQINDSTFTGYRFSTGWAKNQQVFFVIQFNKKVAEYTKLMYKKSSGIMAYFNFAANTQQVEAKVALSFTSVEAAVKNLQEIKEKSFATVKKEAAVIWEKELSKIYIESYDKNVLVNFYTALYHSYLAPVLYSDFGQADVYTTHSLWDTFRAANPLFTFTQTNLIAPIINSYLKFYTDKGLLPVWDLMWHEANTMTGYHAVPIIADAILKGYKGFDIKKAYEAMKKSSMQNIRGTDAYRQYKYLPQDKHGWSVTITLEYAFDDWCIAQVAKALNQQADYEYYLQRSKYYANLFDASTGFFRAKNSDGKFIEPFDPFYNEHGFDGQYIEGTAWQHTWFVPHDVDGLVSLYKGKQNLLTKLDSLWIVSSKMNGTNISADVSGLVGQYAHGNEPSHHITYMYTALNEPKKAADKIRLIANTLYKNAPDGLCGNEDCGQMSAWYVFSALGFYPMNPASGNYYVGSPLITKASIQLPNGGACNIVVKNNSATNKYIQSIKVNGKQYQPLYFTHALLTGKNTIEIVMGNK
jgi:predicted alpha-1,2-mannosidase